MDCRKTLGLGLCLLIGSAGCTTTQTPAALPTLPQAQTYAQPGPTSVQSLPPDAVVKKEADLPRRAPRAATCVAFGDFAASEAAAADISETARREKREQARKAYQQALALDPHCLPAYESLAALYIALQDHAHAVATYQKAAQMFPNEARVFFELGQCHGGDKEWDLAIQALARAVALDPENRKYVDSLGWMQARAGQFEQSLGTFMKVHDEAEAHYRLALMLEHMQQTELCKQQLQAALLKDPRQEAAQAMLAQLEAAPKQEVQSASFTEPAAAPVAPAGGSLQVELPQGPATGAPVAPNGGN